MTLSVPGMKTKLTTLNPRWLVGTHWTATDGEEHSGDGGNPQGRYGMGVSFDCPHHTSFKSPLQSRHRIKIFFTNPIDGLPPELGEPLWERGGGTFKALTVSPADDAHSECWDGFITKGEFA